LYDSSYILSIISPLCAISKFSDDKYFPYFSFWDWNATIDRIIYGTTLWSL